MTQRQTKWLHCQPQGPVYYIKNSHLFIDW